jgi:hypothetical protein
MNNIVEEQEVKTENSMNRNIVQNKEKGKNKY